MKFGRIEDLNGEFVAVLEEQKASAQVGMKVELLLEVSRKTCRSKDEAVTYLRKGGAQILYEGRGRRPAW
jgi:hypothetical protein